MIVTYDPEANFLDINAPELVEISIREDGTVIWVNLPDGCKLRICEIKKLMLDDRRRTRRERWKSILLRSAVLTR